MRTLAFFFLFSVPLAAQETPGELRDRAARLLSQGKYAAAEPLLTDALDAQEKSAGPGDPQVVPTLGALALVYRAEGRNPEAEALLLRSLAIREKTAGADSPDLIADLKPLAALYAARGAFPDSERTLLRIMAIRQMAKGPDDLDLAS